MDMHLSSMTKEELVARQNRLSITVADLNIGENAVGNDACESNGTLGTLSTSGGTSVAGDAARRDHGNPSSSGQPPIQVKGCLKRSSEVIGDAEPPELARNYSGGDACRSSGSLVSTSSSKMQAIRSRSRERARQLHDLAVAQEEQERAAFNGSAADRHCTQDTAFGMPPNPNRRGSIGTSTHGPAHSSNSGMSSSQHHRGRSRIKPSAAKADARAKIHAARVRSKSRERDLSAAAEAALAAEGSAGADGAAASLSSSPRRRKSNERSSKQRAEEEILVQQLQRQLDDQVRGRVNRRGSMASRASCGGGSVGSIDHRSVGSIGNGIHVNSGSSSDSMEKRIEERLAAGPTVRRARRRSSVTNGDAEGAADPPGRRRSSLFPDTDSDDDFLSGDEVVIHGNRSSGHLSGLSRGNNSSGHLSRSSLPSLDIDIANADDRSTSAASVDGRVGRSKKRERRGGRRSASVDGMRRIASLVDDEAPTAGRTRRKEGNDGNSVSTEKAGNRFIDDLQKAVKETKNSQQTKSSSRRSSRSGVDVGEQFLSELNDVGDLHGAKEIVKKTRQPRRGSMQAAQKQLMDGDAKRYGVERPHTSDKQLEQSEPNIPKSRQPRRGSIQAAQRQMTQDDAKKYSAIGNDPHLSSRRGSNDSGKRGRRRSRSADRTLEMLNKTMEGEQIEMDVVFDYREDYDRAKPVRRSSSRGKSADIPDVDTATSARKESMHRSRSRDSLAAMSKSFDETEPMKPPGALPRNGSRTAMDIALGSDPRINQGLERRSSDQRRRRSRSADRANDLADQLAHDGMQEKAARRRSRSSERSGDILDLVDPNMKERDERGRDRRRSRSVDRSSDLMGQVEGDYRGRVDERKRLQQRRSRSMERSNDIVAQLDSEGRHRRRSSRSHLEVDKLHSQVDLKPLSPKEKRGRRKVADRPADITAHLAKLHAPQLAKLNRGLPKDRESRRRSSDPMHVDDGGTKFDRTSRRSSGFIVDSGNSDRYYKRRSGSRDRSQNLNKALGEFERPSDATRERRRSRSADRSVDINKMIEDEKEQDRRGQWLDAHPNTRDRNDGARRRSSSVDRTREFSDLFDDDFAREVGGATILRGGSSGNARASAYFTDPLYQSQEKEKKNIKKKIKNVLSI